MIKDYIEDTDLGTSLSEAGFVAEFWTQRWASLQSPEIMHKRVSSVVRAEEFRRMAPFLGESNRILDGGCGLGEWTIFLTQRGHKVTGLDISEPTIGWLNTHCPELDFRAGDLRALPLGSEEFDIIFSWGAVEHFEEGLGSCLHEAYRVLKPGGRLFVTVPFQNWRHTLCNMIRVGAADPVLRPMRFYQWRFTRCELAFELRLCGFRVLETSPIHRRHGVYRLVTSQLKLRPRTIPFYLALAALVWLPSAFIGHMVFAHAQKPEK